MRRFIFILVLITFAQPVFAGLKKCVDNSGNYHYYDSILPLECQGKTTIEMNKQGVVINRVEEVAPQTMNGGETARLAEAQRLADKKKQDAVLLNIYTSAEEIDLARERNIHPITLIITGIEKRLDIAQNRLAELQKQAEAAKQSNSQILDSIKKDIIPAKKQVSILQKELTDNQEYMETIKAKFETDKKRFLTLVEQKNK